MNETTRRSFLKYGSAAVAASLAAGRSAAQTPPKPNVVLIFIDDLRPDGFASLGCPMVETPNFDALVNRGRRFRRAYTMGSMVGAVCLPSRTMMLTGRSLFHASNTPSGEDTATHTFPRTMKDAGYATMHAGKFGNSPKEVTNELDETYDPGWATAVADKAVDFIERKAPESPMFIYMAGREPHDPQYATEKFYAQYPPEDVPLPERFAPYQPFDNGAMAIRDELTLPYPRTPEDVKGKLARYYASIAYLDAEVGRVVQALKDAGQYDNTIFVIAGDNGLSLGDHGLLGKQNLYEFGGMHVPLVFAGPGIPEGDTDALVYLMDVFPTVCDLAGMSIPANVEGKSLAPVINGRSSGVRDWLYTGYQDGQRSVTNGRWKLIRYPLIDKTQLFDLENDPLEKNDLASSPEHAERIQSMMDKLAELQREYDDPVPLTVPDPQPAAWSPEQLTPEQIEYQIAETERCRDAKPM